MDVEKALEKAEENYHDEIRKIADKFWEEKLIPFCKKNGLRFIAGNGTFVFVRLSDNKTYYMNRCKNHRKMNDLLCTDAAGNLFGAWLNDYNPQIQTVSS